MTYKMSEFTGIDQNHVTKLREAGIENTDDMMRFWADKPSREPLATKMGVDMEQLEGFASRARLACMENVGPKYVEVLLAAGIDGPKSLREFTPEALLTRLDDVKVEKKLTTPMPSKAEIGTWFMDKSEVPVAV